MEWWGTAITTETKLDAFVTGKAKAECEDWTFADADTKQGLHGLHPYPARMIPQVAHRLIERYSGPCDTILDPFCGSGTVLLEARLLNRNSIGVDINPLALLLAKAKTTPIEPKRLRVACGDLFKLIDGDIEERKAGSLSIAPPELNTNLKFWFKDYVIQDLTLIRRRILELLDEPVRNFLLASFSLTARMVSSTRSHEFKLHRIPQKELQRFNPDVFRTFREIVSNNIRRMDETYPHIGKNTWTKVLFQDTRNLTLNEKVDLVVTSPPYGDSRTTVAYGQFSRYSALWCGLHEGWQPEITKEAVMKVDNLSLGGNGKNVNIPDSQTLKQVLDMIRARDESRALDTALFFQDIDKCFNKISETMQNGAHFCIVIGNRTVARMKIPADQILVEIGELRGFHHVTTYYRRIPTKRMPWENAPENIAGAKGKTMAEESIIIIRKT